MPRPPMTPVEHRDWMTTREVATMFDKTTATIRKWITQGKLDAVEVNGYNRVTKRSAEALAFIMYGVDPLPDIPTEVEETD